MVARLAHTQEVAGSSPAFATNQNATPGVTDYIDGMKLPLFNSLTLSHTNFKRMASFKEVMADQNYRQNQNAEICCNCLHFETKEVLQGNRPVIRNKCGIGNFFVKNAATCRLFENKI
jgi:hypothetical protein